MFQIVHAPNSVLSQLAQPVKKVDKATLHIVDEMKQTLLNTRDPEGVGLAAPQIGKSLQIFITKASSKSPFLTFINPIIVEASEIEKRKKDKDSMRKLEGCLSLPTIWGEVQRHPDVVLKYIDEHDKTHTRKFTGFMAVIIQHEYDHLQGILFPKRVLEQKGALYKSKKDKNGKDIFEEIEI